MQTVFVIARDWKLRTAVRAELRELGVDALGLETSDDAGRAIGAGQIPAAAVVEATPEIVADAAIQSLAERVPCVLIASRTETVPLLPADTVLYRPVSVGEIVARVQEILRRGQAA